MFIMATINTIIYIVFKFLLFCLKKKPIKSYKMICMGAFHLPRLVYISIESYTSIMDTTYHSNIPVETLSLLDCDVRNFNFIHPIKNIFFDNIDYIRKLDASGKARPCILDNVERSILCHTCYLGFDQFECTDCDNWNIIPHSCHSRFCNACGVKYAKQLAVKATSFCLDCPHRHIVFTIPEELRNWFRQIGRASCRERV